jgi:hypothetical protein
LHVDWSGVRHAGPFLRARACIFNLDMTPSALESLDSGLEERVQALEEWRCSITKVFSN